MLTIRDDGPVGVWLDKWKRRQRQKAARRVCACFGVQL